MYQGKDFSAPESIWYGDALAIADSVCLTQAIDSSRSIDLVLTRVKNQEIDFEIIYKDESLAHSGIYGCNSKVYVYGPSVSYETQEQTNMEAHFDEGGYVCIYKLKNAWNDIFTHSSGEFSCIELTVNIESIVPMNMYNSDYPEPVYGRELENFSATFRLKVFNAELPQSPNISTLPIHYKSDLISFDLSHDTRPTLNSYDDNYIVGYLIRVSNEGVGTQYIYEYCYSPGDIADVYGQDCRVTREIYRFGTGNNVVAEVKAIGAVSKIRDEDDYDAMWENPNNPSVANSCGPFTIVDYDTYLNTSTHIYTNGQFNKGLCCVFKDGRWQVGSAKII